MTSFLLNQDEIRLIQNVRKLDSEKTAVLQYLAQMYASATNLAGAAPNVIRLFATQRRK